MRELSEDGTRFLVVRDNSNAPVGFVHFRFTVQGEVMDVMCGEPSLFLWDLHIEEEYRRKGLAKHLMMILELIARQQKMKFVSVPIQMNDDAAASWIRSVKGFAPDSTLKDLVGFDAEMEVISR
jgi:ribosomal protein S18 acetylase RimI-like enzyme